MKFRIAQIAEALEMDGDEPVAADALPRVVTGWSIDSRSVQPGDLFFALKGPSFDGHAFVNDVLAKGAAAAVVASDFAGAAGPVLRVRDTLAALQDLARWARGEWDGQVVGVTGSAGKTTTKEVIAGMLGSVKKTAKNEGNLNNHVGLPVSILRLEETAEIAVLEMGMNHKGEIQRLAEIARPNAGVVTNVGYAHIENFESIDGIAAAKRELIDALGEQGVAVLNADDPLVAAMARSHRGRTILYGQAAEADVRAEDLAISQDGARFRVNGVTFESRLPGRHNVSNVLAGIATAQVYGIAPEKLTDAVAAMAPAKMRGERFVHNGITIYNDCYNSNPDAVRMMLEVLRDTPARRRIAVLGEMLELGRWAEPLHRSVGDHAVMCGID
ncbi:MAG: UDP-N-acetylmuramoyl-tripeptide--D-alanyl-D-alanine ligase, partial [Bryobacteraceae bacterium]